MITEQDLELLSELPEIHYEQYLTGNMPNQITLNPGYLEFPLWITQLNLNFNFTRHVEYIKSISKTDRIIVMN